MAQSALELETDIKENMAGSRAAGITYKIGNITRRESRKTKGLKLRKAKNGQLIVGARFHRASARGQPPAIRTGRLINSIRARQIGAVPPRFRVATSVKYAAPLDDPNGLNRPFFISRGEAYRPRYLENMRRAYMGK